MRYRVIALAAGMSAGLVAARLVPTAAQAPAAPSAQLPSSQASDNAAPGAPALPPSARSLAHVSLPRVMLGTEVGRASNARVNEARAQGREREVRAEEERQLQSRVQPLAHALRTRHGFGILLAWHGSGIVWSSGSLDFTKELQLMLDAPAVQMADRAPQAMCRLAFVDLDKLANDSWLAAQLRSQVEARAKAPPDPRLGGTGPQGDQAVGQAKLDYLKRMFPVMAAFGHETGVALLLRAKESGVVWSDPRLDATAALLARLDLATHQKGPGAITWSSPPLGVAYVRMRALAEAAGLARDAAAKVVRLGERLRSQPSDAVRRDLAEAQAKLAKELLDKLAPVAERECRARGITVLFSFSDAAILDADAALDMTDVLATALAGGKR